MTQDELAIIKEALLDARYNLDNHPPLTWRSQLRQNERAIKIITLEQVKLHNGGLKK